MTNIMRMLECCIQIFLYKCSCRPPFVIVFRLLINMIMKPKTSPLTLPSLSFISPFTLP